MLTIHLTSSSIGMASGAGTNGTLRRAGRGTSATNRGLESLKEVSEIVV
jgi:hypothetical protein